MNTANCAIRKTAMRTNSISPVKKILGITAAAALLLGVSACATDSSDSETSTGNGQTTQPSQTAVLVAAIGGEPDQLDPHKTSSYFSFQVLENIFDTLVEPDENLEMVPALAESWEISEDLLTWTFNLRQGVTFHDGSDFTAADVVYSYRRIIDESLNASWRFGAVTDITAADDYTVVITVGSPSPNLLANLGGYKGLAIVKEGNVTNGDIVTKPIGTGPFALDSYVSGNSIALTANDNYWGGVPELSGVEFRFISEGSTALTALRNGEIHWTDSIQPQDVAGLSNESGVVLGKLGSNDYWYLAMNQARAPWGDVRVRQAVAYAINRQDITQAAMQGNATVNQLAIPLSSSWAIDYKPFSTDLDKARELLADAGVSGATMNLMVSSDYPETVTAAQVISAQLAEIGITVEITTLDFSTWLAEQAEGNFDMLMMGWLGNIDPDDFYYAQHHSTGWANAQKYNNPTVDSLLDSGQVETDVAKRKQFYADAARLIADEVSYLYLYNPDVVQAWSDEVSGYVARGDRAIRFRDVSMSR